MEQEELNRKALELERSRREEAERQHAAMEKIRKEQEELARLKAIALEEEERRRAIALEEEERRLQRERWAEEERIRREKWEEEERAKRELERAAWRAEEEERRERLRLEMADERFAATVSMREELEAERRRQEAEEKSKAAVRAAEAEIARAKEEAERRRQELLLQEQKDAEMARNLENSAEDEGPSTTGAVASHVSSTVHTPQPVRNELPDYDHLRQPQVNVPIQPPAFKPEHEEVRPPHMGRPHANTTASISSPPHFLPHAQPFARQPLGIPNDTANLRHSMIIPPDHAQPPHAQPPPPGPMPPAGFPNVGTGQGPPYHNHFFPHREVEETPVKSPGGVPPGRPPGPNKLVRQTNSLGGRDPNRPPAHVVNNPGPRNNGPFPAPVPHHPGHVAGSPSLNMIPSPLNGSPVNGRPSTSSGAFPSAHMDHTQSPGAGGSGSSMAPSPNAGPTGHIVNEFPHGNASQQPTEPLSGIIHGFGRPALRDSDLPAATPVPSVIVLEPEPSPPYYIVAHTWKSLVKFIASQANAIIEPSPVALAREKHGPPNLRVVLHFAKIPRGDYRIVLYFALQSITPPPQDFPSHDTSVPPYMFPAPDHGRPLANHPEAQVYTIPTKPLPVLPMKLPNLAPYLTAALEESQRLHDSRSRLAKLVNSVNSAVNSQSSVVQYMISGFTGGSSRLDAEVQMGPPKAVETSSGQKKTFMSRIFGGKGSGSKGKGLNNDMYDIVTPFNAGDYH